jgi:dTDP-4-amino-4,6-dideoxygalactose transaminase
LCGNSIITRVHGYGPGVALPVYPELTDEQIQYVAGKVKEFIAA